MPMNSLDDFLPGAKSEKATYMSMHTDRKLTLSR